MIYLCIYTDFSAIVTESGATTGRLEVDCSMMVTQGRPLGLRQQMWRHLEVSDTLLSRGEGNAKL